MMNRILFLLLFCAVLLSGCSRLGDVELQEVNVKGFRLVNTTTINVELEYIMNNPSNRKLYLIDVDGLLKKGNVNFAKVTLIKADTIEAKRISVNNAVFQVDILDPLSLLSMGLNLSQWQTSDFVLDARAVVKASGTRKRAIRLKDVPLDNIQKVL